MFPYGQHGFQLKIPYSKVAQTINVSLAIFYYFQKGLFFLCNLYLAPLKKKSALSDHSLPSFYNDFNFMIFEAK